jgi:hypothetical protein
MINATGDGRPATGNDATPVGIAASRAHSIAGGRRLPVARRLFSAH